MVLPVSSLSIVCSAIAEFVRTGIDAANNSINVSIGAPAEAAVNTNEHRVNLFFYRFEPSGFEAAVRPDQPWRIRFYCLITAFGIMEDTVSAGENDLRMLGEVMRIFHETPIMDAVEVDGQTVRLQVVFSPLSDDQLNQVWSTQGDTTYRPSVVYEMALVPVVPSEPWTGGPLVAAIGAEARGTQAARHAAFTGTASGPPVLATRVAIENPAWLPYICFVHDNECVQTLSFDVGSPAFANFTPRVWLAGDPSEEVALVWEVWDRSGWRTVVEVDSEGNEVIVTANAFTTAIDPDAIPAPVPDTFPLELECPVELADDDNAAQALLYAVRNYIPIAGQAGLELRSNPLLINLYRAPA